MPRRLYVERVFMGFRAMKNKEIESRKKQIQKELDALLDQEERAKNSQYDDFANTKEFKAMDRFIEKYAQPAIRIKTTIDLECYLDLDTGEYDVENWSLSEGVMDDLVPPEKCVKKEYKQLRKALKAVIKRNGWLIDDDEVVQEMRDNL